MCKEGETNQKCTNSYKVIDEHTITVKVPEKNKVTVGDQPMTNQPFNIALLDTDGEIQNNGIKLYYYREFNFSGISSQFAYSNEEKPLMIFTDFQWENGNDFNMFKKKANFTCRFTGTTSDPPT